MTNLILLALAAANLAWVPWNTPTAASLRGLRVVSPDIIWASGTGGTFLRTADGGAHWQAATVPDAAGLDFRDVEAFDAERAYLLASGEGDRSRVYKTMDGGVHWELVLTNPDVQGFFDAIAFWDENHGILLGDPVAGHFVIFTTNDAGKSWQRGAAPEATVDEGAFAASGTALVVQGKNKAWFVTGGPKGGRVFRSDNGGKTWRVAQSPLGGEKTAGIFSIACRDAKHAVAVGGDYKTPEMSAKTAAWTKDGGKTWHESQGLFYQSGVTALASPRQWISVGPKGSAISTDDGATWERFSDLNLNAAASSGNTVFAVGPKGMIVKLERRP